ncbi:hypothetical protein [Spiroplasma floricola]|uniref:Uncharacterized protein n=1 Tax=Spiroplasma floricola 23-6 TaxID=1336749 RepID=A0A2K8SEZ0_9MOLU|nr:hypothetical protein [Spiroplasma floricola]AUB32027.1 hypothetical protein SFLOR_v1c09790 [Spiroplasma floricola 23-6]
MSRMSRKKTLKQMYEELEYWKAGKEAIKLQNSHAIWMYEFPNLSVIEYDTLIKIQKEKIKKRKVLNKKLKIAKLNKER